MKKFLTQQINFAYAMIVMLILVLGVSAVSAGYAAPGNLTSIDPIIHRGGGEQATDSLRLGTHGSPIGNFDMKQSNEISLFDTSTTGAFFSALYNGVFLDNVYISEDVLASIVEWGTLHNGLSTPTQQVNVEGDVLITSLANVAGNADVCITKDGTLIICPNLITGTCGLSHGHSYLNPPSTNLCGAGTPSSVTTNPLTFTWDCVGTGGTASCYGNRIFATNGLCGSAEQHASATPPTTNLCANGSASAVQTNSSTYTWSCYGTNGGTDDSCSKIRITSTDAVCNDSYTGTYGSQPATNTATGCYSGIYNDLAPDSPDWIWECLGTSGGADDSPCTATKTSSPVNAQCHIFGGTHSSQPGNSGNGCDVGVFQETADDFGAGEWLWNCLGSNGGTNDSCDEDMATDPPVCTTYSGLPQEFDPVDEYFEDACQEGTWVDVADDNTSSPKLWKWKCTEPGHTDVNCEIEKADGYAFICGTDPTGSFGNGNSAPGDSRYAQWTRGNLYSSNSTGDEIPYTQGGKDCSGALDYIWMLANPHVLPSGFNTSNPANDGYDQTMINPVGGGGDKLYWKYFCLTETSLPVTNDCFCNTAGAGQAMC